MPCGLFYVPERQRKVICRKEAQNAQVNLQLIFLRFLRLFAANEVVALLFEHEDLLF